MHTDTIFQSMLPNMNIEPCMFDKTTAPKFVAFFSDTLYIHIHIHCMYSRHTWLAIVWQGAISAIAGMRHLRSARTVSSVPTTTITLG